MNRCGCGWPLSITGKGEVCTACELADQRRRAGHCVDCGSSDRVLGVYCQKCFEGWMGLYADSDMEPSLDEAERRRVREALGDLRREYEEHRRCKHGNELDECVVCASEMSPYD